MSHILRPPRRSLVGHEVLAPEHRNGQIREAGSRKSSFNRLRARPADEPSPASGNAESGHFPKPRWRTHRAPEATSWRSAPRRSWSRTGLRSALPRGETDERARRRDDPAVPPPQSGPARWSSSWGAILVRSGIRGVALSIGEASAILRRGPAWPERISSPASKSRVRSASTSCTSSSCSGGGGLGSSGCGRGGCCGG